MRRTRGQGGARQLGNRAGKLDALDGLNGYNHESQKRRALLLVGLALGLLEGEEDAAPYGGRVFERLEASGANGSQELWPK